MTLQDSASETHLKCLQVNTRWTSDDRIKEVRPLNKFRKILLRGVDNPGMFGLPACVQLVGL